MPWGIDGLDINSSPTALMTLSSVDDGHRPRTDRRKTPWAIQMYEGLGTNESLGNPKLQSKEYMTQLQVDFFKQGKMTTIRAIASVTVSVHLFLFV